MEAPLHNNKNQETTKNGQKIVATTILKSPYTNSAYQSTFLPLIQKADTTIKKLIIKYFYECKSKQELKIRILAIINNLKLKLPKDLPNPMAYIGGLIAKSNNLVIKYYDKKLKEFSILRNNILKLVPIDKKVPKIASPKELKEYISENIDDLTKSMKYEAKGTPRVLNYEKEIKEYLGDMSRETMVTSEPGKKPISLWQKAELDIRHEKQMARVQEQIDSGVELAWISSHPDSSKRCEKWQGKLVSLTAHSTMTGFRIKRVDGHWVYSLPDIMAQKDKYGYNNNIICGFNCRHYTIPYEKGTVPPKEYSAEDIKKQRAVESHIRELEREIRRLKTLLKEYEAIGDLKNAKPLKATIRAKTQEYKHYCSANGYAWEKYRIEVD